MYTLYYYNEAHNISTIDVETLTQPIRCPENLFFIALRKNKTFITEPALCIEFTVLERLYIRSFGLSSIPFKSEKSSNFRLQNSYLKVSCGDGEDGEPEKCNVVVNCNCECNCGEPQIPVTIHSVLLERGTASCSVEGILTFNKNGAITIYSKKSLNDDGTIGISLYLDEKLTQLTDEVLLRFFDTNVLIEVKNGVIIAIGSRIPCVPLPVYRFLSEVQLTGRNGEVITLQYTKMDGTPVQQTWTVGGSGEEVYYAFGVGERVVESSVGLDGGILIANIWID